MSDVVLRRSSFDIVYSILCLLRSGKSDGMLKTHVVYRANLNWMSCKRYLMILQEKGLVVVSDDKIKLTPAGFALVSSGEFDVVFAMWRKYEQFS